MIFNKNTQKNEIKNFSYNSEYQDNISFLGITPSIKCIAFYLPQYHEIEENNLWWGKGFTEWVNVKKAIPLYDGHYEPRYPSKDIGFYDLTDVKTIINQAILAKEHGIYGFCLYYYWFSGKRLLEKPLDIILKHKEIDINFCLCWANENWTRSWDGLEKKVLISQEYTKEDPSKFIIDIKKYLLDERYIRIDGKPIILIYNPEKIPNVKEVIQTFRKTAMQEGIGDIYIICRNLMDKSLSKELSNCDAFFDFSPIGKNNNSSFVKLKGCDGYLFNYNTFYKNKIKAYLSNDISKPFYYTSTMGWDNSPRKNSKYTSFINYNLTDFYNWNRNIIDITKANKNDFFFVNAWNEWGEGTYLEPDEKYGYANINTLSKAILDVPLTIDKKIAIQIHIYHMDLLEEITECLQCVPYPFDCFVSTNLEEKKYKIENAFSKIQNINKLTVEVFENKGRDIAPFIIQMSNRIKEYDYICHIHTKKSVSTEYGIKWRNYLYRNLFGSKENVSDIINTLKNNDKIGIIFPDSYPMVYDQVGYPISESNKKWAKYLFKKIGIPEKYLYTKSYFPAGSMFFAKVNCILPLFENNISMMDFPDEAGQFDGTISHAIERAFVILANHNGYDYCIMNKPIKETLTYDKKHLILYANLKRLKDRDIEYINRLKKLGKVIILTKHKSKKLLDLEDEMLHVFKGNANNYYGLYKSYFISNEFTNDLNELSGLILTNDSVISTNSSFVNMHSCMDKFDLWSLYENQYDYLFFSNSLISIIKSYFMDNNTNIQGIINVLKESYSYDVFIKASKYYKKYIIRRFV